MKYANTSFMGGQEAIAKILPLSKVPGFDPGSPPPFAYAVPDGAGIGWVKKWIRPPEFDLGTGEMADPGEFEFAPPEPSMAQLIAECTAAVQRRLDSFAQGRGYDGIHAAAGYAGDEDPQFALEGGYCHLMRSRTWRACYEIMGAVLSGQREAPSLDELMDELPELEWPDAPP